MGCPLSTRARVARNIAEHPAMTDYWLDYWVDVSTRATDWDAAAWGFNPVTWMAAERFSLSRRRP